MKWLELHIDTNHNGIDTVVATLSALDIDGVIIDDEADFQDFLENNHDYWDYVDEDLEASMKGKSRVTFYLLDSETGYAQLAAVRMALERLKAERSDCGSLILSMENIQDADWENSWKKYYKPIEIGDRLMVIPQWELENPKVQNSDRVPLILDPGLTFGTGNHATTRLCLMGLEKAVKPGDRVLDLGCGSGILSIASLLLGAAEAKAVDIDEKCLTVAYENAGLNGIGKDTYTVMVGNVLTDPSVRETLGGGYNVVLANIVADVIIGLAPMVRSMMAEGATFLCSGIIDTRAEEVAEKLKEAGLEPVESRTSEGWYAYTCR